jgi:hypothetical protein
MPAATTIPFTGNAFPMVKFCSVLKSSSYLTSSHLISSQYLISSRLISSHLISSHLTSSHFISWKLLEAQPAARQLKLYFTNSAFETASRIVLQRSSWIPASPLDQSETLRIYQSKSESGAAPHILHSVIALCSTLSNSSEILPSYPCDRLKSEAITWMNYCEALVRSCRNWCIECENIVYYHFFKPFFTSGSTFSIKSKYQDLCSNSWCKSRFPVGIWKTLMIKWRHLNGNGELCCAIS